MKFVHTLVAAACGITAAAALAVSAQAQSAQNTTYPSFSHAIPNVESEAAVAVLWKNGAIARYKNVINVEHPAKGIYCVRSSVHLDRNAIIPIATPEASGSTVKTMYVYVVDNGNDCTSYQNAVDIRTYTLSGSDAVLSDGISFYMIIT